VLRCAVEDRACEPSTMRDYRNTVERRVTPFFGGMRLDAITPQMIETWRALLTSGARTENKQRKPADYGETDKAGETRFLGLPAQ
jgi:hypothetical protein